MRESARPGLPIHELVSAPPLLAAAVLALNDHLFKAMWPGWWTGKLSDVAGLFYFPLLLTAGGRLMAAAAQWLVNGTATRRVPPLTNAHLFVAIALTALVFSAINVWEPAMAWWSATLSLALPSAGTTDPTDLLALPVLGLTWLWGARFVVP